MKPSLEKRSVALAGCLYNNEEAFLRGWEDVVLPTLRAYPRWQFEIRIADNSPVPLERAREAVLAVDGGRFQWWGGQNLKFSSSVNQMARDTVAPRFVYLCAPHCHLSSPQWLEDLLLALESVPQGIAGHVTEGPKALPFAHVQGGVFAIRTEELRRYPFPEDLPHDYSDVIYSRQTALRGGSLVDVPGLISRGGLGLYRRQLLKGQLRNGKMHLLHLGRVRNRSERQQRKIELQQWGTAYENRRVLLGSP